MACFFFKCWHINLGFTGNWNCVTGDLEGLAEWSSDLSGLCLFLWGSRAPLGKHLSWYLSSLIGRTVTAMLGYKHSHTPEAFTFLCLQAFFFPHRLPTTTFDPSWIGVGKRTVGERVARAARLSLCQKYSWTLPPLVGMLRGPQRFFWKGFFQLMSHEQEFKKKKE